MRMPLIVFGTAALLLALNLAGAGQPVPPRERIAALIAQLGSDSFLEREQARTDIEAIGPPALAALRSATRTGDLETARRAADLIRVIEERSLTRTLLAPTKVRLRVKDMPVLQAVEKLAKLSACELRVDGDRTALAARTVSLDTGEVTFWEALDLLGARAGLVEKVTLASVPGVASEVWQTQAFYALDNAVRVKRGARRIAPPLVLERLKSKESVAAAAKKAAEDQPAAAPIIAGRVILRPSSAARHQVSYAGAARVLLHPLKAPTGSCYDLLLDAAAEPRLLGFNVIGVPTVTRAIDEHGQELSFVIGPAPADLPSKNVVSLAAFAASLNGLQALTLPGQTAPRGVTIRLQAGARPAQRLKELSGSLTAQVIVPHSTLLVIDDILQAKGKCADIQGGGRLHIRGAYRQSDTSAYWVDFAVDHLPSANGPVNIALRGQGIVSLYNTPLGTDAVPALLDAKGRPLAIVNGPSFTPETTPNGQTARVTGTVVFRRAPGVGAPARFVVTGTAMPVIVVPFRFADVPLR